MKDGSHWIGESAPPTSKRPVWARLAASKSARFIASLAILTSWWSGAVLGPVGGTYASLNAAAQSSNNAFTTSAQFAPQSVTATASCPSDVQLTWTPPGGSWASSYSLYGSTTSGTEGPSTPSTLIASGLTAATYFDGNRLNGTLPFYYKVTALDSSGAGGPGSLSAEASVSGCPPTVSSTAPNNGATSISLTQPNGDTTNPGITINFGTAVQMSTVTSGSAPGGSTGSAALYITPAVSGATVSWNPGTTGNSSSAILKFDAGSLATSTTYTVTLTTAILSQGGVALASNNNFVFSTGSSISTNNPVVTAMTPASGNTNVTLSTTVVATFSKAVQTSTVSKGTTFCVYPAGGSCTNQLVAGSLAWSGSPANSVLTFTPSSSLTAFTVYTVAMTTAITDGTNPLLSNYSSSFTTGNLPDTTPPTITNLSPASALGSALASAPITITFSKAMNQGATEAAFCLFKNTGGNAAGGGTGTCASNSVSGSFAWNGNTMTFTPTSSLTTSAAYAFTIAATCVTGSGCPTTSATDTVGNVLSQGNSPNPSLSGQSSNYYNSSFQTAANCTAGTASPANLFPGGYETVIGSFTAGFNNSAVTLFMDATATVVGTGTLNASGCYSFTVQIPQTTTTGTTHTIKVKTSGGTTVNTSPTFTVNAVSTLALSPQKPSMVGPNDADVLIVSLQDASGNPAANAGISMTAIVTAPSGGGWASYSTTSGTTDGSGNFQTNVSIAGAPGGATSITVAATTGTSGSTGCPGTSTCSVAIQLASSTPPPTVSSVTPSGGVTGQFTNTLISASFSEAMTVNTTSGTAATFCISTAVSCTGTVVSGFSGTSNGVTYTNGIAWGGTPANSVLTFKPNANLTANTVYNVTIGSSEKDSTGVYALTPTYATTFKTGAGTDSNTPRVTAGGPLPAQAASTVDAGQSIAITFNVAMSQSATQAAFCLYKNPGGNASGTGGTGTCAANKVSGTFAWNAGSTVMTFTPSAALSVSSAYLVSIAGTGSTAPATDTGGVVMTLTSSPLTLANNYLFSFATSSSTTTLTLSATKRALVPPNDSTLITANVQTNGVALSGATVNFSASESPTSTTDTLSVASGTTDSSGNISTTLTINNSPSFSALVVSATLSLGGATACPNGSTCSITYNALPAVSTVTPTNGATGVTLSNTQVVVTFTTGMQPVNTSNDVNYFCLYPDDGGSGAGSGTCAANAVAGLNGSGSTNGIAWSGSPANSVLTFTPASALNSFSSYYVAVGTSETDFGGLHHLASAINTYTFTTANIQDTTLPNIVTVTPAYGASSALPTSPISITFSKAMNQGATAAAFCLFKNPSGTANGAGTGVCATNKVAGSTSWNGNTMTFTPSVVLAANAAYAMSIAANGSSSPAADTIGNALTPGNSPNPGLAQQSGNYYNSSFKTTSSGSAGCSTSSVLPVNAYPGTILTYLDAAPAGFQSGDAFTATWNDGGTNTVVSTGNLDSSGCFSVQTTVPLTTTVTNGANYTLTITDTRNSATTVSPNLNSNNCTANGGTPSATAPCIATVTFVGIALQKPGEVPPNDGDQVTVKLQDFNNNAIANAGVLMTTPVVTSPSGTWAGYTVVSGTSDLNGNFTTTMAITNAPLNGTSISLTANVGLGGSAGCPALSSCSLSIPLSSSSPRPAVSSTLPVSAATNVSRNSQTTVTFSESMTASTTSNSANFFCLSTAASCGGTVVAGTISWGGTPSNSVLTFTPSGASPQLAKNTTYNITVGTSESDSTGTFSLETAYTSTFTTINATPGTDTTPPTVSSVSPAQGTSTVNTGSSVVVTFSGAMAQSATEGAFCLFANPGGNANGTGGSGTCASNKLAGTFSWNAAGTALTFTSPAALSASSAYLVSIAGNGAASPATDLAGNAMLTTGTPLGSIANSYVFSFATNTSASTLTVSATKNALVAPTDSAVVTANVKTNGTAVSGATVTFSLTYQPSGTLVTLTPTSAVTDASGNASTTVSLSNSPSYENIVVAAVVTLNGAAACPAGSTCSLTYNTLPAVSSVNPLNGTTGVSLSGSIISITFSTAMQANYTSNSTSYFCLYPDSDTAACTHPVAGSGSGGNTNGIFWNGSPNSSILTFTPASPLSSFTKYDLIVGTSYTDYGGQHHLSTSFSSSFTTADSSDVTAPTISTTSPAQGDTGADPYGNISITFSKTMDHGFATSAFCLFANPNGSAGGTSPVGTGTCANNGVSGSFTWNGNTMTFTPSQTLNATSFYKVTIAGSGLSNAAKDGSGNLLSVSGSPLSTPSSSSYNFTFETTTYPFNGTVTGSVYPGGTINYSGNAGLSNISAFGGKWNQFDPVQANWNSTAGTLLATANLDNQWNYGFSVPAPMTAASGTNNIVVNDESPTCGCSGTGVTSPNITVSIPTAVTVSSARAAITAPNDAVTVTANVRGAGGVAAANAGVTFTVSAVVGNTTGTWATLSTSQATTGGDGNAATTVTIAGAPSNFSYVTVTATVGKGGSTGCPTNSTCAIQIGNTPGPGVTASLPSGAAVAVNSSITAMFSESMTATTTSNSASFFCLSTASSCGGTVIAGTLAWGGSPSNSILAFKPASNLTNATTYFISVGTSETDASGLYALSSAYSTSFTTSSTSDGAGPTLSAKSPAQGATTADTGSAISVTFNEAMNQSATEAAFCLFQNATGNASGSTINGSCTANSVSGLFSWPSSSNMVFTPTNPLVQSSFYVVSIAGSGATSPATDQAGNAMLTTGTPISSIANSYTFAFGTSANVTTLVLSASKTKLTPPSDSSTITATVKTNNTNVANGTVVTFSVTTNPTGSWATFATPPTITTTTTANTAAGVATTTLSITGAPSFDDVTIAATVNINGANACPNGSTCSVVLADPPPPPPSSLVATPGSIWLAWTPPQTDRIVGGYRVAYGFTSQQATPTRQYDHEVDAGKASRIHIEDVVPSATYYLAARSYGPEGKLGEWSDEVSITLPAPTPGICQPTTASATATATPGTATPTAATCITTTPTASATLAAATATVTPRVTGTATVTLTPTKTPAPCDSDTATPTPTPGSPTPTMNAAATGTATSTATSTPTVTPAPCSSPTATPTETATATATASVTETPVAATTTASPTAIATATPTATTAPSLTATPMFTSTATSTPTPAPTLTNTPPPTPAPTRTSTPTPTAVPQNTSTPTATRTNTPVPTVTATHIPPTATP